MVVMRVGVALATLVLGFLAPSPAWAAAPTSGQCWTYDAKALSRLAVPGDPVSCEGPHRAETFAVGTLPAGFPKLADAMVRQVVAIRQSTCTPAALAAYLGSTGPLPSRFRAVAVFPSDAQVTAGERWVRCDLVYDTGRDFGAMPKPAPAWVAENAANPIAFAFCTPGVGFSKMPSPTNTVAQECTAPTKQWILVSRPTVGKPAQAYPGANALDRRTSKHCARFRNVYNGGFKDPYARGWSYIYPMPKGWNDGVREATCWVPLKQYLDTPR